MVEETCLSSTTSRLWPQIAPRPPAAVLYLKVHVGVLHDQHSQGRDVDTGIALSCQEELIVLVLREEAEEILKGLEITLGNLETAGYGGSGSCGV